MAASDNTVPVLPKNARLIVSLEPITVRVEEAATLLGISRSMVYDITKREDFGGSFKVGGCTLISVEALKEWVRDQTGKQTEGK